VLDDKIAHGPGEHGPAKKKGGWLSAAAELADPAGASLTQSKRDGA